MSTLHLITSLTVTRTQDLWDLINLVDQIVARVKTVSSQDIDAVHHHVTVTVPEKLNLTLQGVPINPQLVLQELLQETDSEDRYFLWPLIRTVQGPISHFDLLLEHCRFDDTDVLMFLPVDTLNFSFPPYLDQLVTGRVSMLTFPGPAGINGTVLQYGTLCRLGSQGTLGHYLNPEGTGVRQSSRVHTVAF